MRDERGFLKFSLYQDVEDADTFNLIQEWETADDLDNQIRSEGFRVLIGALKVLSEEAEVRYQIGSKRKGVKVYETTQE
jgi:quinol monooxygenase YgiN